MEKKCKKNERLLNYMDIVFLLAIALIGVSACIEDFANVKDFGKCKSIKSPQKLQTKFTG